MKMFQTRVSSCEGEHLITCDQIPGFMFVYHDSDVEDGISYEQCIADMKTLVPELLADNAGIHDECTVVLPDGQCGHHPSAF